MYDKIVYSMLSTHLLKQQKEHTKILHVSSFVLSHKSPTYMRKCSQGKGKAIACLNYVRFHKDVWGSGATAPRILNLGTRCRWMVSFTPR